MIFSNASRLPNSNSLQKDARCKDQVSSVWEVEEYFNELFELNEVPSTWSVTETNVSCLTVTFKGYIQFTYIGRRNEWIQEKVFIPEITNVLSRNFSYCREDCSLIAIYFDNYVVLINAQKAHNSDNLEIFVSFNYLRSRDEKQTDLDYFFQNYCVNRTSAFLAIFRSNRFICKSKQKSSVMQSGNVSVVELVFENFELHSSYLFNQTDPYVCVQDLVRKRHTVLIIVLSTIVLILFVFTVFISKTKMCNK